MDRRDFIKLTAITGTSATLASCGNPEHQLIRFVPDDDVVARARSFGGNSKISQSATLLGMRALQSDPISVRITYTD